MNAIIFDIETEALPFSILKAIVPPFNPDEVAIGNRVDPAKIAAFIDQKAASYWEEVVNNAALSAVTGRVLAIGVLKTGPGVEEFTLMHPTEEFTTRDETSIIKEFWDLLSSDPQGRMPQVIGFNSHGFDLPFLVRRSWALGLKVPQCVRRGRYWETIDLMEEWGFGSRQERISLDQVSKFFGLPGKNGSGKEFASLYKRDQPTALEYLKNDLRLTRDVAVKMGVIPAWNV